jgi:hypothetical protein
MTAHDALRRFLPMYKHPGAFTAAGTLAAELKHLPLPEVQEPSEISHATLAELLRAIAAEFDHADLPRWGKAYDPTLRRHYVRGHLVLIALRQAMRDGATRDGVDPNIYGKPKGEKAA